MIIRRLSYDRNGTHACLVQTAKGKVLGWGESKEAALEHVIAQLERVK